MSARLSDATYSSSRSTPLSVPPFTTMTSSLHGSVWAQNAAILRLQNSNRSGTGSVTMRQLTMALSISGDLTVGSVTPIPCLGSDELRSQLRVYPAARTAEVVSRH